MYVFVNKSCYTDGVLAMVSPHDPFFERQGHSQLFVGLPPAFDCAPKHTAKAFRASMREDIRILGGDNPTCSGLEDCPSITELIL